MPSIKNMTLSLVLICCTGWYFPAEAASSKGVLMPLATGEVAVKQAYGEHTENVVDMTVKIRGGNIKIRRIYEARRWQINPQWNGLEEVFRNNILYGLSRNNYIYKKVDDSTYVDERDPNNRIAKIAGGYKWSNRGGEFIDFDDSYKVTAYSDKNNNVISMTYDAKDRVTGVTGPDAVQEIWVDYTLDGSLNVIGIVIGDGLLEHADTRKVTYTLNAVGQLTQVTDTRGKNWTYTYGNATSVTALMTSKVDPQGKATTITYAGATVASITDRTGRVTTTKYEYDKTRNEYYQQEKTPGGRVTETWMNESGVTIRTDVNGVTESSVTTDSAANTRTTTDALGNKTVRHYDQWDNVTKTVYADGSISRTTYSAQDNLITSQINQNGVENRYEYDATDNLTKVTEAFGKPEQRVTDMTYDANGNLFTITRQGDAQTTAATAMTYDAKGNLLSITDAENQLVFSAPVYNKAGQLLSWKDGRLLTWQQTYDEAGNLLTLTNPMVPPQTVTLEYDSTGNLIKQIAPDATFSELTYDAEGRPTSMIDPLLATTSIEYNAAGLMQRILDAENKAVQTLNYDLRERPVSVTDGAGNAITTKYGRDGRLPSQLAAVITPLSETQYQYDALGRPTTVTTHPGATARVTSTKYDAAGNVTESTDANGKVTRHTYDALNRLIQSQDMTTGDMVQYSYDNRDNLLTVTNEKGVVIRSYAYNKNNQKITETWAGGEVFIYAYGANGNLTEKLDARGQVTRYDYDNANRLNVIRYYADIFATDPLKTVNYSYDTKGRFTGYNDSVTSSLITYDAADRKFTETTNFGPFSKTISYSYYKNGLRKTFTSASPDTIGSAGTTVTLNYDAANRWQFTSLPGEGAIAVNSYNWMLPTKITLPGGATQSQQYDAFGQVTQITSRDPASNILMDLGYTHDKVGNILSKSTIDGATQYTYDDRYRLTGVDAPGTADDENYSYDPAGNRITAHNTTTNWQYNGNNQLQSHGDTALEYDANGNTVKESDASTVPATLLRDYFYDPQDRLTEIKDGTSAVIANYDYDPMGRRIRKTISSGTTYYLYNDDGLIAEYDSSGNEMQAYGYVPGSPWGTNPLYTKTIAGYAFYHTDHLGTPQLLTAKNGAKVWEGRMDAFGQMTITTETVTNNLRFPGQYYDHESGQHYNYFRNYDPRIGRYMSSDLIGLKGGLNTYGYVDGNPFKYIDYDGLKLLDINPDVTGDIDKKKVIDRAYKILKCSKAGDWFQSSLKILESDLFDLFYGEDLTVQFGYFDTWNQNQGLARYDGVFTNRGYPGQPDQSAGMKVEQLETWFFTTDDDVTDAALHFIHEVSHIIEARAYGKPIVVKGYTDHGYYLISPENIKSDSNKCGCTKE